MDFEEYIWYLKKDLAEDIRKELAEEVRKETAERIERENTVVNILELLEEYGEIPESLRQELEQTQDIELLKKYLKLAAKAGSVEEFEKIRKGLN
ncbi:MAG: hypothetical protein NC541_06650 [bacterium]|nr:hypothetical protein [bacterium]